MIATISGIFRISELFSVVYLINWLLSLVSTAVQRSAGYLVFSIDVRMIFQFQLHLLGDNSLAC